MSLVNLLVQSLVDGLKKAGVNANVTNVGNKVRILIPADEVKRQMLNQVPQEYRAMINVESGDIVIEVSVA